MLRAARTGSDPLANGTLKACAGQNRIMRNAILVTSLLAVALWAPLAPASEQFDVAQSAADANLDQMMRRQRANMVDMQRQIEELQTTTDPARRRQLLLAHRQKLEDNMRLMQRMSALSMRGHGQGGGRPAGGYGSTPDPAEVQRYAQLQERLDMLQMMMEQVMMREQVMANFPAN